MVKEYWLNLFQAAVGVVDKQQSIVISAYEGLLEVVAVDSDIEVCVHEKVDSNIVMQAHSVPARRLYDVMKTMPDGDLVKVVFEQNRVHISSGSVEFAVATATGSSVQQMVGKEVLLDLEIPCGVILNLFELTSFAVSTNEIRPTLNGILMEIDNNTIKLVATDSHRLAVAVENVDMSDNILAQKVIIPRKAVFELMKALGSSDKSMVALRFFDNFLQVKVGRAVYSVRLINGNFPDYDKVFPEKLAYDIVIDKEILKSSLLRVGAIFSEKIKKALLCFNNNLLSVKASNDDQDKLVDNLVISCDVKQELSIGFNVSYIIDFINHVDTEMIQLSCIDSDHGVIFSPVGDNPKNYHYVVMPLRI